MAGFETPEAPPDVPEVHYDEATLVLEKHPSESTHSGLLKLEYPQVASPPLPDTIPLLHPMPFRPFVSLNDFVVTNVVIQDHISARSANCLLSTYPPGHLTFHNYNDIIQTVDQAYRSAPMVR